MIAASASTASLWHALADSILDGHSLTREEASGILNCDDTDLLNLLAATYKIRHHYHQNKIQLYQLKNAKSGLCPEDCGYCSQSIVSDAKIDKYAWLNEEKLMAGALQAKANQARTYCIVASGRGPTNREVEHVSKVVEKIKAETGLHICCCLGLLKPEQADRLKAAGVDRINHNLNTSRKFYESVCSTHTYEDRIDTLKIASNAGMELCSGLIVGMGETLDDIVDVVMELKDLNVESIPVNFLNSIDGTPLEEVKALNPRYCLKVLCLLRMAHPRIEIRIAGGREINLRSMQAFGLYAANSLFVSDYLTTKGQLPEEDHRMIEDMGFVIDQSQPVKTCETAC